MSQDDSSITWTNDTRKLSELIPQRDNPRQIRKAQAERLVKSWHKFNQPDVISIGPDNKIYNGHQRYWVWGAAYGDALEVAVRVCSRLLTDREQKEFTVYMHEGTVAEWDWEGLANWEGVDVGDLVEWGFSEDKLLGAGFSFEDEPPPDPGAQMDKSEELQQKWQVQAGDLWEVGRHRVICGDCTDGEVVKEVMMNEKLRLVCTDPPYGVKYGDKLDATNPMGYRVRSIDGDNLAAQDLEELIRTAYRHLATHALLGAALYTTCPPGTLLPTAIAAFSGSGFMFHWGLVWVKDQFVLGRGDYHFRHENILYGWKHDGAHLWAGDRMQDSVFEIPRPKSSPEHPTMKPVELISRMIFNSSHRNDIVADPFS